jgi:glycosyltransferase involved in cell wall biosynthesis
MRICFYNVTASYSFGGLETSNWEVGRALAARGHEVTVVAGAGGKARNDAVQLLEFPFKPRHLYPDLGTRFRKLMERLSFARNAAPHLLEAGYDAVIVNKPFDFPALAWARRKGMGSTTLFRSGGTDFFTGDRWFATAVDHMVSSSAYNARQVEARYRRPVQVIHNGVDTGRFQPGGREHGWRRGHAIPDDARLLISVGRLVGWKGLQVIVEAIAPLDGVHYAFAGEGPMAEPLLRQAAELGISDRVHRLGGISHDRLPAVLRQADVFVQPSVGEEAFGITLVEAMAVGLPVLASRQGGMPEIVIDGETGRLLPAGDVAAWRQAIAGLDDIPDLGRNGRQRVLDHFTWEANAAKVEQLLNEGTS